MFSFKETFPLIAVSNFTHKVQDQFQKSMALKVLVVGKLPHYSTYVSYMFQNLIELLSYFSEILFSSFIIKFIIPLLLILVELTYSFVIYFF